MNLDEMKAIVADIDYPGYRLKVATKGSTAQKSGDGYSNGAELVPYLQACYDEPDIVTGDMSEQCTRKWMLSFHMVKSEIVQTALKMILTSHEHRTREHFKYKGERVFSPHFDVDAMWQAAREKRLDYRGKHS